MRSHLTKALTIILLTAFFGIPWGLYNQKFAEDARNMTQEQWLAEMGYQKAAQEHGTGLAGTLVITLVACAGLAAIYEFTKWASVKLVDNIMGPEGGNSLKP